MKEKKVARAALKMLHESDVDEIAELTVSEMARRLGVSLPYLSRAFRNQYGVNPGEYLETEKFNSFLKLVLCYNIRTAREGMERLDIRSPSHFIKRYRDFYGRTPGQVCRKYRKKRELAAREEKRKGVKK